MRIGLVTTSFPRFEGDVAGAFVLGFARALVDRGHTFEVLAPEPAEPAPLPAWPSIDVRWVPYLRPRPLERTFYGAGVPDNLFRDPRAWLGPVPFALALARETRARADSWDALVSHWALPCALAAGSVARGRPHLAVLHSGDVHLLGRLPARTLLARRIARGATALLFASRHLRDVFLSFLPARERVHVSGRCHASPMGIDLPPEPSAPRRTVRSHLGFDRFTLLSMGRLVPIKGLDMVLRAIAGMRDTELVVAGEGPERERLARVASAWGARTRFVGVARGDYKAALLAGADAFVCPSRVLRGGRTEGSPTALLEAMAAGLAVVASDVGGIGSIVRHQRTGLLVPPDNPEALRTAITSLRDDRNLRRRLGRAARTAGRRYDWGELGPHIDALLTAGVPGVAPGR